LLALESPAFGTSLAGPALDAPGIAIAGSNEQGRAFSLVSPVKETPGPVFVPPAAAHSTRDVGWSNGGIAGTTSSSGAATSFDTSLSFPTTFEALLAANDPLQGQMPRPANTAPPGPLGSPGSAASHHAPEGGGGGSMGGGGGGGRGSANAGPGTSGLGGFSAPVQDPLPQTGSAVQTTTAAAPADPAITSDPTATPTPVPPSLAQQLAQQPLVFEANQGQTDAQVAFLARGGGMTLFLTQDAAVPSLARSEDPTTGPSATRDVVRMTFAGANPAAQITGDQELTSRSNYFSGSQAVTNVANYQGVIYHDLYPGIDLH